MVKNLVSRRHVVFGATALGVISAVRPALSEMRVPVPRQTPGPFYPNTLPLDHDTDLTWVRGQSEQSPGTITDISGRVITVAEKPLTGVRVEVWQCDATGHYHHLRDRGGRADPRFQGCGRMMTDGEGRYRFRTIKPVAYPGRAPHIHFAVSGRAVRRLTTQMYVAGESANARDVIYNSIHQLKARISVTVILSPALPGSGAELAGNFDIVLGLNTISG